VWNWELDHLYYPNWTEMVGDWRTQGIRPLTYVNPFFSNPRNISSSYRRNYYAEGITQGFFVKDQSGDSYLLRSGSIDFCLLDLTNPDARVWMKGILKEEMMIAAQSSGWMAGMGDMHVFVRSEDFLIIFE
jgi:sulfoquinovosidase